MEYFTKSFAFLYWVMYLLDLLKIFTRTLEEGSTNTEDEDDVFQECAEPTTVETQNVDVSQQTDDETQTVDGSQQTDETDENQKHKAREEELLQEIFALQNELQTAYRVSGESKRKADKLAWDLGMYESRYQQETAELARKRSDEIIQKEIEIMNLQDEYDNRLADLELANTNLMQRILELEIEQAGCSPQHDPVCDKRSGELEKSVTKIESIQEHLTSLDVITEHAKWTINHVLEQVKEELTSVANESSQPDYDKVRLIKDTQAVKCEMEKVKLELEDAKERLVKDTLTIKAELVSVKLELVGAKETIVDMEQRHVRFTAAESQLKTIVDGKDVLLASKETELEELRGSLEQAQRKSQVKTRDVECDTEDLPQPVKPKGNDVGCCTDEFPQLVKPKVRDVSCKTEDVPTIPKAKKDTACGTDDLPPIPAVKEVQAASADEGKQTSDEGEKLTEFSEVVSKKKRAKAKAEAAAESVSIYETVMEVLSPSQFPPLSGKRPARQPSVDVKPVRPTPVDARPARQPSEVKPPVVFPSADIRYKQKPIESYTVNPSEGKQQPPTRPQADAAPKAAPAEVPAPSASKPAPRFTIVSREIKQLESEEKCVLVDIHQSHYGRVVGRGGENVRRLQETHGVALSFAQNQKTLEFYDLKITGGSAAKRRACAREIIDAVPVTIECSNVDLRQLRHPKFQSSEGEFFVKIQRPTTRDEKLKITGRIKDCRMAFDLLVNGIVTRPSR
ncbi:hypothetical protein GHT06_011387 [Daphnia sinensis]|uniref:K Homology domain-containing protein n=1 Tax=Daphnia sinensis TaxID=1820382 RepID=A0AAD5L267_9CRUS|nr:hypothetical protein GHT06_011387 [Daphnia sinensis]